jgi:hypothetical protein
MWELHQAANAFGVNALNGLVRSHVVPDRSRDSEARVVGLEVWLCLGMFSQGKPTITRLGKPSCAFTEEEWKAGGRSYLKNGGGRHKKSEGEVNGLIEKVLKVQELNAQALASPGQIQIPDSDGSESAVESGGDDEDTQERGSSKPSAEGGSLGPSTTITTGDESNQ